MKSLILAASYATRLHPLTEDFPKSLLNIGGKSILDRLLTDIDAIDAIDAHLIVTNDTYHPYFRAWKARTHFKKPITLLNDGAMCSKCSRGAVSDILYVIEKLSLKEDLLIVDCENVVDFSFKDFVDFGLSKDTSCVGCYHEPSIPALQKTNVLVIDDAFKVEKVVEKPETPPSNWAAPPFCYYKGRDLKMIYKAVAAGIAFETPGHLAAWLCNYAPIHAWELPGKRYEIGDVASYEAVNELFSTYNK